VAAAAQTYFNAPLEDLTLEQAAYLAALPQAPSNFHPVRDYDRAISRRNYVLREMYENGYIDQAEMERATAAPLETVQGGHIEPYRATQPPRNYFTDEIRRQLSAEYGEDDFFTGGYAVRPRWTRICSAWPNARCAARWKTSTAIRGAGAGLSTRIDPSELEGGERPGAQPSPPPRSRATSTAGTPPSCWRWARAAPGSGSRMSPRTRTAISSPPRMSHGRGPWTKTARPDPRPASPATF
jgi:hypothetical protein